MKCSLLQRSIVLICLIWLSLFFSNQVQAQHCTSSPIIQIPSTYLGCPGDSITPAHTGHATAMPGDSICSNNISVTYTDSVFTNTFCQVLIRRSWTAKYVDSTQIPLSSTREQVIWLTDNDPPHITDCPSSVTLVDTDPVYNWSQPDISDDCGIDTIYSDFQSGHSFPLGTTEVTYTAIDHCGNSSTCSFSVTVQLCQTTLTIDCPKKYNGCSGDSISVGVLGTATFDLSSNACGTPELTYRDTTIKNKVCNTKIERIWRVEIPNTDISAECRQVIRLRDVEPPQIDCPPDVTIDAANPVHSWNDPTVTDNCGNDSLYSNIQSGYSFPLGKTYVTYTAVDKCGNKSNCTFTVNVVSCTAVLSLDCPKNYNGCPGDDISATALDSATYTVIDNTCGTPILTYRDSIVRDNVCNKKIERIWNAHIPNTNVSVQCTQIIKLKDKAFPIIENCPSDVTFDIADATYNWTEPIATDDCQIVSFESNVSNGTTFPLGTTYVTYIAKDLCGDSATCAFSVTIIQEDCIEDLQITCPPKYVGCRQESPLPSNTGYPTLQYSANDCDTIEITYEDHIINNGACRLRFDRIWTASVPGTAIKATCTQRINLKDFEAPVIHYCPPNVKLSSDNITYSWPEPYATDNCGLASLESSLTNPSKFPVGFTEVVYTATDSCGNTSTCSFTVEVEDDPGSSLLISCPEDIALKCGDELHIDHWPLPHVNTTCKSCTNDYLDGFVYMGQFEGHRYFCSKYESTWEDAHEKAAHLGGYLAVINSEEENDYLTDAITVRSAYIGLNDKDVEGTFKWANGDALNYTHWYPGQPNNYRGAQDYVELLYNGYWNDQYNYKKLEFIIEFPCVKIEQTKGPYSPEHFTGYEATIEYKVTDACGNTATCSFDIKREGTTDLVCPDDIVVNLDASHYSAYVEWEEPIFESCCSYVRGSDDDIPNFVYMGSRNGHKYYCSEYHATWHDAQDAAEMHGGYLAVIDDEEENYLLANFLTVQSAYIGLSDHQNEGHFKWVNGSALSYTNWYPNQPNNYGIGQHYVEILSNGQWNDHYSYKKREFIIEIPGGVEIEQIKGPPSGSMFEAGTTYIKYKAKDACGNVDTCSFTVEVIPADNDSLCDVGDIDSDDYWIESFQLGSFKNVSGNNGGYANFSNDCIHVHKGDLKELKLSPGFLDSPVPLYWSIFIDWNEDGQFKGSELIARGKSSATLRGYFKFSSSLPTGKFPLRITMNPYGYHYDGCEILAKGEIEDYCIEISSKDYNKVAMSRDASKIHPVVLQSYDLVSNETSVFERGSSLIDEDIHVYPNPFVDRIEIIGGNIKRFEIFSADGTRVRSVDGNDSDGRNIDLGGITSGLYLVLIERMSGKTEVKKILKQ